MRGCTSANETQPAWTCRRKVPDLSQSRHPPARKSALGSPAEGGGKEPHPQKRAGVARARELESGRRELQRARFDGLGGGLELQQQGGDVDAPVRGAVGREAPARLLELAFAADPVTAPGLVPGDRHVNEPLEEVAFGRLGGTPRVFQLLVSGEELAGPN